MNSQQNTDLCGQSYGWIQDLGMTIVQSISPEQGGFQIAARWHDGRQFMVAHQPEERETLIVVSSVALNQEEVRKVGAVSAAVVADLVTDFQLESLRLGVNLEQIAIPVTGWMVTSQIFEDAPTKALLAHHIGLVRRGLGLTLLKFNAFMEANGLREVARAS